MNGSTFEYTGYIESINVKGAGPTSHQFLFSVVSAKGDKHWSFLLDTESVPLRYGAMASLLAAAYAGGKVVRVNTAPHVGGPAFAAEIEVVRDE